MKVNPQTSIVLLFWFTEKLDLLVFEGQFREFWGEKKAEKKNKHLFNIYEKHRHLTTKRRKQML